MFEPHKLSGTRFYWRWRDMIKRCYDPNNKSYIYYGAKGIKVCKEWKNSFPAFLRWSLENGYCGNLTLDRIDSKGNYEPDNCQWITKKENCSKAGKMGKGCYNRNVPEIRRCTNCGRFLSAEKDFPYQDKAKGLKMSICKKCNNIRRVRNADRNKY